jgi:hypothetical protein
LLHSTLVETGTKRHFAAAQQTVALGPQADIATGVGNVAFDAVDGATRVPSKS